MVISTGLANECAHECMTFKTYIPSLHRLRLETSRPPFAGAFIASAQKHPGVHGLVNHCGSNNVPR